MHRFQSSFRWKVKVFVFSHFLMDSGLVLQDSFTNSTVVYRILMQLLVHL